MTPKEPYRIAFVGVGRVADVHYAGLQNLSDRARLAAFSETRPEAVEQRSAEWNVPGYQDMDEMIEKERPDALAMMLPHDVHEEMIAKAAAHKLPVFLEKPLAVNREEGRRIAEIVKTSGITLLVAHNGLFHPAFEQMADIIRKGWIGKPTMARGVSAGWLTFREWDFRLSRKKTGGGCWIDAGGHLVYCLREILGEVAEVSGVTASLSRPEMEGEDHAMGVLRYESGPIAQLFVSYGHKLPGYQHDWPHGYLNGIEVYGDQGGVRYQISPTPELSYFSEIPEAMPPDWQGWLTTSPAKPYAYSFEAEMAHFLDCLDGKAQPKVSAEDACATIDVLVRLYENENRKREGGTA